jgi:hypothetical protein
MLATLEINGAEVTFEVYTCVQDEGIGHYEFWGRPGFDKQLVERVTDLEVVEIEGDPQLSEGQLIEIGMDRHQDIEEQIK